jgi:hypothetical protein
MAASVTKLAVPGGPRPAVPSLRRFPARASARKTGIYPKIERVTVVSVALATETTVTSDS